MWHHLEIYMNVHAHIKILYLNFFCKSSGFCPWPYTGNNEHRSLVELIRGNNKQGCEWEYGKCDWWHDAVSPCLKLKKYIKNTEIYHTISKSTLKQTL